MTFLCGCVVGSGNRVRNTIHDLPASVFGLKRVFLNLFQIGVDSIQFLFIVLLMNNTQTIQISKTVYQVESEEVLECGDTCFKIRKGKTVKTLIGKMGNWFLWSAQNGMNQNRGLPKYVEPTFNTLKAV